MSGIVHNAKSPLIPLHKRVEVAVRKLDRNSYKKLRFTMTATEASDSDTKKLLEKLKKRFFISIRQPFFSLGGPNCDLVLVITPNLIFPSWFLERNMWLTMLLML